MAFQSNASVIIQLYTLFQALIFNTKIYNWRLYADIIRHIFRIIIFNFSIRFIWLNSTYIIPNFCRAILYIYRDIGKMLCYQKKAVIWRLVFLYSVIIEHDVISECIVIVNAMFILAGVISINLCLFFLMY